MPALPAMPVTGHAASTLNFETLNKRAVSLESKVKTLEKGYTKGTAELTYEAGKATSTNVKVTHNLGKAPSVVMAVTTQAPAFGHISTINVFGLGATEFEANGETKEVNGAETKIKFFWLAVA